MIPNLQTKILLRFRISGCGNAICLDLSQYFQMLFSLVQFKKNHEENFLKKFLLKF